MLAAWMGGLSRMLGLVRWGFIYFQFNVLLYKTETYICAMKLTTLHQLERRIARKVK